MLELTDSAIALQQNDISNISKSVWNNALIQYRFFFHQSNERIFHFTTTTKNMNTEKISSCGTLSTQ